jgi:ribosomal protein S18 acetylase RimI-like enzyme
VISIRTMTIEDIPHALLLWQKTEGVRLRDADSPSALTAYLNRNPGLSFVAMDADKFVGVLLAGHDGRRGYLQHMAIDKEYRNQGIGRQLVDSCLQTLQAIGIEKCHLFVLKSNTSGADFWHHLGWTRRDDVQMFSISSNPNA